VVGFCDDGVESAEFITKSFDYISTAQRISFTRKLVYSRVCFYNALAIVSSVSSDATGKHVFVGDIYVKHSYAI
jgi:hypothetical protein